MSYPVYCHRIGTHKHEIISANELRIGRRTAFVASDKAVGDI